MYREVCLIKHGGGHLPLSPTATRWWSPLTESGATSIWMSGRVWLVSWPGRWVDGSDWSAGQEGEWMGVIGQLARKVSGRVWLVSWPGRWVDGSDWSAGPQCWADVIPRFVQSTRVLVGGWVHAGHWSMASYISWHSVYNRGSLCCGYVM